MPDLCEYKQSMLRQAREEALKMAKAALRQAFSDGELEKIFGVILSFAGEDVCDCRLREIQHGIKGNAYLWRRDNVDALAVRIAQSFYEVALVESSLVPKGYCTDLPGPGCPECVDGFSDD